jgi:general secretion pathway protein I
MRVRRREPGFTLLEVMIALAILGLSLVAISRSHQNSIRAANRARLTTVATLLARYKLMEVEDKLFEEGFSDFKQEEKESFKEEGFERFSYTLVVDKVELPANVNADAIKGALGSASGSMMGAGAGAGSGANDPASKMGAAANLGASVLASQFEMIRNVLEQSIRRASLKVEWKEGSQKREVTVVGYFTDPRKIDAALGGGIPGVGALPGTTGTTGATGATGATGVTGVTGGRSPLSPTLTPATPTTPGGRR